MQRHAEVQETHIPQQTAVSSRLRRVGVCTLVICALGSVPPVLYVLCGCAAPAAQTSRTYDEFTGVTVDSIEGIPVETDSILSGMAMSFYRTSAQCEFRVTYGGTAWLHADQARLLIDGTDRITLTGQRDGQVVNAEVVREDITGRLDCAVLERLGRAKTLAVRLEGIRGTVTGTVSRVYLQKFGAWVRGESTPTQEPDEYDSDKREEIGM